MNRTPVTSSNIKAIGYDEQTNILEVEFNNGGVYSYADVPVDVHKLLMTDPHEGSHGKHIHRYIKGVYVCTKIEVSI